MLMAATELIHVDELSVTLPTGTTTHKSIVEVGTPVAIWLCFVYLAYKLWATYRRLTPTPHLSKSQKEKTL